MNRHDRRKYAKANGIKMPAGYQDSSEPVAKVAYVEVKRKSRSGVEYTHLKPVLQPIKKGIINKIFAK